MSQDALRPLLEPRSIAVVGASRDLNKAGGRPLRFLRDQHFGGPVFGVTRSADEILGYPCVRTLAELPAPVDLAVVAVSTELVLPTLRECVQVGIPASVVFTAGFAEVGEAGAELQGELMAFLRDRPHRMCGPNSVGLANLFDGAMATFSQGFDEPHRGSGPIAWVSQSGAFGSAVLSLAQRERIGFGYFVNSGNEAQIEFSELAAYVLEDPRIHTICGYLEGLRDGPRFLQVAERARSLGKPLIVVKGGRSRAGTRAATTHTASITGADDVYDATFRQYGVLRTWDADELLDVATTVATRRLARGPSVGVLTTSGGAGILLADHCEALDLEVPELSARTRSALAELLPGFAADRNPVDSTSQWLGKHPGTLRRILERLLADDDLDVVVALLVRMEWYVEGVVEEVSAAATTSDKPLVVAWIAPPPDGLAALRERGVPAYPSITRCARALAALRAHSLSLQRHATDRRAGAPISGSPDGPMAGPAGQLARERPRLERLDPFEVQRFLALHGVPMARSELVGSAEAARRAAEQIGGPVAMKLLAPGIVHKSDAGAVALGVEPGPAVEQSYARLMAIAQRGLAGAAVLVQEMVPAGCELLLGATWQPPLGCAVSLGFGGTYAEILRDVSVRLVPFDEGEVWRMLRELRGFPILEGARGRPRADLEALVAAVTRFAAIAADLLGPRVASLEINPLIVLAAGRGVVGVDARAAPTAQPQVQPLAL